MKPIRANRVVTVCAVVFLALDSILLIVAAWWSGSTSLYVWGIVFGVGAVLVVFSWQRYQRRIAEINEALRLREIEFMALQREFLKKQDRS